MIPRRLPWNDLHLRARDYTLTAVGAEIYYALPFSYNGIILRPFQIETD